MKTAALVLLVAFPSMSWAQLGPMYPQTSPASADAPTATSLVPVERPVVEVFEPVKRPIYKEWYFWSGVGVVVTSIIATSIAVVVTGNNRPIRTARQLCPTGCDACIGLACP